MTFFRKPTDRRGVALFIVLASMATLAVFVGEITYTAQINQKLAYDKLDQVKAHALAKSGLRLALLRIRAYSELKKTVSQLAGQSGANAQMVDSVVPKDMIEKIWSEPVTIPFSGDISGLPGELKDAVEKFRKESGMEGKLYLSIQAQSNKVNLNSTLPAFAAIPLPAQTPTPTPAPSPNGPPGTAPGAEPSPTPVTYNPDQSRQALKAQLEDAFRRKSETDDRFRDRYGSFRVEDLAQEIFGWSDLSYESPREQVSTIPFKKAPFYDISELLYLPSVDEEIYGLLASQFHTGVASTININTIREPVLRALIPQMTNEEVKKFFEFRDKKGDDGLDGNKFKNADGFFNYLKEKIQFFSGSATKITDLKNLFIQRGIQIVTDESNFLVRVEATVQQTKRTLEALVSIVEPSTAPRPQPGQPGQPQNGPNPQQNTAVPTGARSNLKITQLRFL